MRTMQLLQALAFDTKDAYHNSASPFYVIVLKGEECWARNAIMNCHSSEIL